MTFEAALVILSLDRSCWTHLDTGPFPFLPRLLISDPLQTELLPPLQERGCCLFGPSQILFSLCHKILEWLTRGGRNLPMASSSRPFFYP